MGRMTRGQLLAQSGAMAGNDLDSDEVRNWLNAWLSRTAKSWSWPCLKYRVADVELAAGSASVTVGLGGTGPNVHIHRLLGGYVLFRNTAYTNRGRMLVSQLLAGNPDNDESVTQASARQGTPITCKVRVGNGSSRPDGCMRIYPHPVPSETLYLAFDALVIPADMSSDDTDDDDIPWYPNDRTLQQAVKCAFMELDDQGEAKENLQQEMDKLGRMVIDDRDFDGEGPGDNQEMELDKSVFR